MNPQALWPSPSFFLACPAMMTAADLHEVLWAPDPLPLLTPGSPDLFFMAGTLFKVWLSQFIS